MTCSSKRPSSASAAIIDGNEDLLIEFLLFFPAKSLVKFKVVSKKWRSVISSPFFCRRHILHPSRRLQKTQSSFLLGLSDGPQFFLCNPTTRRLSPVPLLVKSGSVRILQSCNGLLFLKCRDTGYRDRNYYLVVNPTTAQQRDLSPLPHGASRSALYLIFDPSLSPHYKVVCFDYMANSTRFQLYDSETQKWRLGGETTDTTLGFRNGIYSDGGICFLRYRRSSSYRFVADNNVSMLPDPPRHHHSGDRRKNYTMESNGVLVYMTLTCMELHVSEMKSSEKGWRIKYRIYMDNPIMLASNCEREWSDDAELLCMIRGEEGEGSLLLLRLDTEILIYRFGDDVFEVVEELSSQEFRKENPSLNVKYAHHFIHSLAPV